MNFTEPQSHKDTNVTISLYYCIYIFTVIPCNLYIYICKYSIYSNCIYIKNIYIYIYIRLPKKTGPGPSRNLVPVLGDSLAISIQGTEMLTKYSDPIAAPPLRYGRYGAMARCMGRYGEAVRRWTAKKSEKNQGVEWKINVYMCLLLYKWCMNVISTLSEVIERWCFGRPPINCICWN